MVDFQRLFQRYGNGRCMVLAVILAGLAGVAAGRNLVGRVSVVDGVSMDPSFPNGTRIAPEPITGELERGDVILLDDGRGSLALKRIVGLPGETIALYRGYVFIGGRLLREPYLHKYTFTYANREIEAWTAKVPLKHFFVMGDNRPWSMDSRSYGAVPASSIKSLVPRSSNPARPWFDSTYTLPSSGSPRLITRSSRQA